MSRVYYAFVVDLSVQCRDYINCFSLVMGEIKVCDPPLLPVWQPHHICRGEAQYVPSAILGQPARRNPPRAFEAVAPAVCPYDDSNV